MPRLQLLRRAEGLLSYELRGSKELPREKRFELISVAAIQYLITSPSMPDTITNYQLVFSHAESSDKVNENYCANDLSWKDCLLRLSGTDSEATITLGSIQNAHYCRSQFLVPNWQPTEAGSKEKQQLEKQIYLAAQRFLGTSKFTLVAQDFNIYDPDILLEAKTASGRIFLGCRIWPLLPQETCAFHLFGQTKLKWLSDKISRQPLVLEP